MTLSFRYIFALCLFTLSVALLTFAQTDKPAGSKTAAADTPTPTPTPAAVDKKKPEPTPPPVGAAKGAQKVFTAEQIIESTIFFYGYPGGRVTLNQIRKTTQEKGNLTYTGSDGKAEKASYQRFIIRGDSLGKEKIRLDQDFTSAKYALVFADEKVFGIYNNTAFTPREDASQRFENQIIHGLEALLRYKENESKLDMGPREKVMGVDYYVIEVTDKLQHKTKFYISAKTFRVMMLTYEEGGVKYKRKFYDYNYAQGTLVPYRTVLWANDKIAEESEIGTITFGQKVEEELFKVQAS